MATVSVEPRMTNPLMIFRDALRGVQALSNATREAALPDVTRYMVHLRASQINGCSFCADMHSREMREAGESDERIFTVAAWREAPFFSEAERAALALTEALTRIADHPEPVPDELWDEVRRHYDEPAAGALILEIAAINVYNRINVAIRQPAGAFRP